MVQQETKIQYTLNLSNKSTSPHRHPGLTAEKLKMAQNIWHQRSLKSQYFELRAEYLINATATLYGAIANGALTLFEGYEDFYFLYSGSIL